MTQNFVYVFNETARDSMLEAQFVLLKSDPANHIYVFANKTDQCFSYPDVSFILSDTLTF